ncbi:MAG: DUF4373 domain-containing protein [Lachnospirales bacterium]
MARDRTIKVGLDYFSHDIDLAQDVKVKLLKAKYGLVAYAIYLRLLEEVYGDKGYFLQVDEDVHILFCDDNKISYDEYILILNECIEKGLFNKSLYEKYSILTSKRIQLNYLAGTERRKEISMIQEYLLVSLENRTNVNILTLNVDNLTLNVDILQQSKVKESKVKKSKVKERESNTSTPEGGSKKIQFAEFVSMTNDEYTSLVTKVGEYGVNRCIEILDNYKGANGKKYTSDYRAILNWVIKRYDEEQGQIRQPIAQGSNKKGVNTMSVLDSIIDEEV